MEPGPLHTCGKYSGLVRDWVIKVSKFCNLRCRYCYEWNSLQNAERMSLSSWRQVLEAVRTIGEEVEKATGLVERQNIIWHGGEPTILPLDYMESVMDLQHRVLPETWFQKGRVHNALQTNLYSIPDQRLDFLLRHDFTIGVSFDVVAGARRDIQGRPTEAKVRANLAKLEAHGIQAPLIVVVAAHTARESDVVYEYLRARGTNVRLLPLFRGPAERDIDTIAAGHDEVNAAFVQIFRAWFADGCPFEIQPLKDYLTTVVMKMLGLERDVWHAHAAIGPKVLLVDTDGRIYEDCTEYTPESVLGDINSQTIGEIVTSPAYRASLEYNRTVAARVCAGCEYLLACRSTELFRVADDSAARRTCVNVRPILRAIETHLREQGIDESEVASLLSTNEFANRRAAA